MEAQDRSLPRDPLAVPNRIILVMIARNHFHQIFLDNCRNSSIGRRRDYDATYLQ